MACRVYLRASSVDVRESSNVERNGFCGTMNLVVFLGAAAGEGIERVRRVRESGVALGSPGRGEVGERGLMPRPRGRTGRAAEGNELAVEGTVADELARGERGDERGGEVVRPVRTARLGGAGARRMVIMCGAGPAEGPSNDGSSSRSTSGSSFESAEVVSSSSESEPVAQGARSKRGAWPEHRWSCDGRAKVDAGIAVMMVVAVDGGNGVRVEL